MNAYFDDAGRIRKELLDSEAEAWAKKFVSLKPDNTVDNAKSLNSAQLRRFYNEFKSLEKKLEFREQGKETADAFLALLPLIKMIKSKVAYASNPKSNKIPKEFADWLRKNIDWIETAKDFKVFMLHFEAVVGFYYGQGVKNA